MLLLPGLHLMLDRAPPVPAFTACPMWHCTALPALPACHADTHLSDPFLGGNPICGWSCVGTVVLSPLPSSAHSRSHTHSRTHAHGHVRGHKGVALAEASPFQRRAWRVPVLVRRTETWDEELIVTDPSQTPQPAATACVCAMLLQRLLAAVCLAIACVVVCARACGCGCVNELAEHSLKSLH